MYSNLNTESVQIFFMRARKSLPMIMRVAVLIPILLFFISRAEAAKWDASFMMITDYGSLGNNESATKYYAEKAPALGWSYSDYSGSKSQNNLGFEAMLRVNKFGIGYYTSKSLFAQAGNEIDGTKYIAPGYYSYCYSSYWYVECGSGYDPGGESDYNYALRLPAIKSAMVVQYQLLDLSDPGGDAPGGLSLELGYGHIKLDEIGAEFSSQHAFSNGGVGFGLSSKAAPLYIIGLDLNGKFSETWGITMKLSYHKARITDIYAVSERTGTSFRLRTGDGTPVAADYSGLLIAFGAGFRFGSF